MKNILLIYGQDTFSSRQKLESIKQKYLAKTGQMTDLITIDSEESSANEINQYLLSLPLLTNYRLIIIYNLLTKGKVEVQEKILDILNNVSASTLLIFYEQSDPDRRLKIFKKLNQPKQAEQFAPKSPIEIKNWIKAKVQTLNSTIDDEAINQLSSIAGVDLWRLNNEIEKLSLFSPLITRQTISQLIEQPQNTSIFNLVDAIGERNFKTATILLKKLFDQGENGVMILGMIAKTLQNLVLIKSGAKPSKAWPIHPYVLRKTAAHAKNFKLADLKTIYQRIAKIDYLIKIGKIESEDGLALFLTSAII